MSEGGRGHGSSFLGLAIYEDGVDFILRSLVLASLVRETFEARVRSEEFLLHPPFRENGCFLWLAGVCAIMWDIWGKRNERVFRG